MRNNSKIKKTILAGVDFTDSSVNAVNYAALLAQKCKLSLTLFHVFDVPVVNTWSGSFFISYPDLVLANQVRLNKYVERLKLKFPSLEIKTLVQPGSVKYNVKELTKGHSIFCVVIGLETRSRISKFIYGTTGTEIAGRIQSPVIIVPKSYKNHKVGIAAFAVDNKKSLSARVFKKIESLKDALHVKVKYVHVRTPDEVLMDENLEVKKVPLDHVEAEDLASGMTSYNRKNHIDLNLVVSHTHSPVYRFFTETNTKKISLASKIPVLAIHD